MSRKKTTRKVETKRVITLKVRTYDPLERLVFWLDATPEGLDLGDRLWSIARNMMLVALYDHLQQHETATVEKGRDTQDTKNNTPNHTDVRVPVLRNRTP